MSSEDDGPATGSADADVSETSEPSASSELTRAPTVARARAKTIPDGPRGTSSEPRSDIDDPDDPQVDDRPPPSSSARMQARRIAAVRQRFGALRQQLVPERPEHEPSRARRYWLLLVFIIRRWLIVDRCGGLAASLTIHTLLSTVPTIGVALLVVDLMDPQSGAALLEELFTSLVPETQRANAMAHEAMKFASRINVSRLGVWGFGVTLSIAFVLFSRLEQTFNRIWRVTRRRSVLVKFTMFYTLATLGPALMLFSLAEPLFVGLTQSATVPVLTTGLGLVLLNRYMPYTGVRWGPALAGGLMTAVLIELGKVAFGYYATRFALRTYEGLYGSLAIFPIIIVWSYLSWMVILLGAEIGFVIQQRKHIALQGFLNHYVRERTEAPSDSGRTAARLLLAICDRFSRFGEGLGPEALGERFRLPLDRVSDLLTQLERHGYLVDTDTHEEVQRFVPARPLDQILVLDVLVLFDHEHSQRPRADRLGQLFDRLDHARAEIMERTSYADLVAQHRR